MTSMISRQYTRSELESELSMKGKDLTKWIRDAKTDGRIQSQLSHIDPSKSAKRETRYFFVAQNSDLFHA